MTSPNKAIYIGPQNELFATEYPDPYEPGDNQGLVRVHYSGINPADLKHGLLIGMNDHVCGYEFSGKVIKAGTVFPYAVGDEIFGSKSSELSSEFGAHQDWLLAEGNSLTAKRPSTLPKDAAAVLSIAIRTAADALFNLMEIPFSKINASGTPTKSGVLIWGGGSAVGWAAIQLAKAAGISPIITTASASRHQALKDLGATHCFDYHSNDVVAKIQAAVDACGQPLKHIFDTVCTEGQTSSSSRCDLLRAAPDATFVATALVKSDKNEWRFCLATRVRGLNLPPPIGYLPGNKLWESCLIDTVSWAAENYGKGFRVPNIRVVEGLEEGIVAIKASSEGKISFGKVAIKHPF